MSASVVTCIGCLQCGATCGQCASRSHSELALPAGGVPVCLKPRLPACSIRLSREPHISGSAPQLGSPGRLPAPSAALAPSIRLSAPEPGARLSAPRPAPTAKDGKRIRDACDFGDSTKLPEAVTKRKKDDPPAARAGQTGLSNGNGTEAGMEDARLEEAVCNGVGGRPAPSLSPSLALTESRTSVQTSAADRSPPASAPARLCQVSWQFLSCCILLSAPVFG